MADLPLQGREHVERILAPVRFGDPPLLHAEEDWIRRLVARRSFALFGEVLFRSVIDELTKIGCSQSQAGFEDPVAPGLIKKRIVGNCFHAPVVPQTIAGDAFKLINEEPRGRWRTGQIFGLSLRHNRAVF